MTALVSALELPGFTPGLELNRRFYREILRELLSRHFPDLPYSAALAGEGSDVLGFDSERSMDHNWGPRGVLFLSPRDHRRHARALHELLVHALPPTFLGFPTNFTHPRRTYLVQQMSPVPAGPVNHLVRIFTLRSFFVHYLGLDPDRPLSSRDWLTLPQQALLEVTGGDVFHDGLGRLEAIRAKLAYYPRDVWLYMMYCQWLRVANELSYQARSGEGGDELGSRILAARMVEELVKLAFLIERRYIPYSKWRGSAFLRLGAAMELGPVLEGAIDAATWRERQVYFGRAYQILARRHNELGITIPVSPALSDFHGRGYTVIDAGSFMEALKHEIEDEGLRNMRYEIGSVDQFINHARINHERYLHRVLRFIIK